MLNLTRGGFFVPKIKFLIFTKKYILRNKSSSISPFCEMGTTLFLKEGKGHAQKGPSGD
ncbi:hypothetical protein TTE1535 [Caldanaerobacter subterraneus subsp. tengcongensis MB4]|uniref:Uncharacterized protein n=1 Tax=Caldanaerobacter subterraneus subsp. tengcongensis (strain DSM 15242 / JCM 11007 / NBRC 100824 / MB4) TaxID=273068 RepID=Q8R9R4_CALS4|nr:hypothetical protein TTE1535 [Caldanaerobacter subterraneus subsp. tengcongensis MB4]